MTTTCRPALKQGMRRNLAPMFAALVLGLIGSAAPVSASAAPYVDPVPSVSSAPTGSLPLPDGGLHASSGALSLAACNKLVKTGIVYHPAGWKFSCSYTRVGKNENGWTYKRETVIKAGMTLAKTKAVLAHEESHIWSLNKLTPSQMTWFSRQIA